MITLKQFLLKKFPTNVYMDCPIPKHHWETIEEYANLFRKEIENELKEIPKLQDQASGYGDSEGYIRICGQEILLKRLYKKFGCSPILNEGDGKNK